MMEQDPSHHLPVSLNLCQALHARSKLPAVIVDGDFAHKHILLFAHFRTGTDLFYAAYNDFRAESIEQNVCFVTRVDVHDLVGRDVDFDP